LNVVLQVQLLEEQLKMVKDDRSQVKSNLQDSMDMVRVCDCSELREAVIM
jgi:hypothetical protein